MHACHRVSCKDKDLEMQLGQNLATLIPTNVGASVPSYKFGTMTIKA